MNEATRTDRPGSSGTASVLATLRALVPDRHASFTEALRIAEQQAQRLLRRAGIDAGPVPEDLLLDLPRISIEYVHGMPTSGCSFWDGTCWIIQVNASEPATRQRFTLFHEYKHIVDHGRTDQLYGSSPNAGKHAEQSADYFAGCALMPRPLVKRAWSSGSQTAEALAAVFDVSPVAAGVRLAQIGLVDQPTRCDVHRSESGRTYHRVRTGRFRSYYRQPSPAQGVAA